MNGKELNMSSENNDHLTVNDPHRKCGSGRRFLAGIVTGFLLGSLLVGSISLYSHSQNSPGLAPFTGHGHFGAWRLGSNDPAVTLERADFITEWMLKKVNATDEQSQKIKLIVQETAKDLLPMKEQHLQNRQAIHNALLQPTVNRDALKTSRQAELQLADAASNKLVDALADIADTLTLEQRTQLAEMVSRFHR
jgi:Spy/CpxP family protein refolding chaperone